MHLDGYDLGPSLQGKAAWPRNGFIYWTDDGSVAALRHENWKVTFLRQDAVGMDVWQQPFTELRADAHQPAHGSLRAGPGGERHGLPALVSGPHVRHRSRGGHVGQWLQSFRGFPPRQKPGTFNLDRVMEAVTRGAADK